MSYRRARGRFPSFRWVLYVIIRSIIRKGRFPRFWVAEDESFDRIPRRMSREILARVFFEIRFRPDAFVPDAFVPDAVVPDAFAAERRASHRKERIQHRSHFGSRYTLGCCDLAGLFSVQRAGEREKLLAGG